MSGDTFGFLQGDLVVALKDGTRDNRGRPVDIPLKGRVYRITFIYSMNYGWGCELEGLNPDPFYGYFLVKNGKPWFERLEASAETCDALLDFLKGSKTC